MSKRIKINFKSIVGDNFTTIPKSTIYETNDRIKKALKSNRLIKKFCK